MRELGPRIHLQRQIVYGMDCRVNPRRRGNGGLPGNDD
jgi:hypothetical protein